MKNITTFFESANANIKFTEDEIIALGNILDEIGNDTIKKAIKSYNNDEVEANFNSCYEKIMNFEA